MKGQDQNGLIDFYFYVYLKRKKLNLKDICLIRAQPPPLFHISLTETQTSMRAGHRHAERRFPWRTAVEESTVTVNSTVASTSTGSGVTDLVRAKETVVIGAVAMLWTRGLTGTDPSIDLRRSTHGIGIRTPLSGTVIVPLTSAFTGTLVCVWRAGCCITWLALMVHAFHVCGTDLTIADTFVALAPSLVSTWTILTTISRCQTVCLKLYLFNQFDFFFIL